MLRASKSLRFISQIGAALFVLILAGGIVNVQANPVCTSTIVLPGGIGTVLDSALGTGVCVQSTNKLYGNFNLGNTPVGGSMSFGFTGFGAHTITSSASFQAGVTYTDSYEVQVLQGGAFPTNNNIVQVRADFAQTSGGPTTLVQTTSPAPSSGTINLSKTGIVATGTFATNYTLAQAVKDLIISGTFTLGAGSDASARVNTIVEQVDVVTTPEPASVETLVLALTGLAFGYLKLRSRQS